MRYVKAREWTKEDFEQIKLLYENGNSIAYIAKQVFHCREATISKIIKENDFIKGTTASKKLTINQEQEICELYLTKKYTQKFLAEKYNVNHHTIKKVLEANDIDIIHIKRQDLDLVEDYFKVINSPEKAYLLGFLFADGNVYKNQISLEINYRDIEILHLLRSELHSINKISYRKRRNIETCCCRIYSQKIVEDLAQYGIIPNKTHRTKHLPIVPKDYRKDFLRGLLDGDGWITKDRLGYYHIGFVSNYATVCQDFQDLCNSLIEYKTKAKITNKGNNSGYVAQFQSKESVKQLATALYKDSTCYLTRKYILATDIFESKMMKI